MDASDSVPNAEAPSPSPNGWPHRPDESRVALPERLADLTAAVAFEVDRDLHEGELSNEGKRILRRISEALKAGDYQEVARGERLLRHRHESVVREMLVEATRGEVSRDAERASLRIATRPEWDEGAPEPAPRTERGRAWGAPSTHPWARPP